MFVNGGASSNSQVSVTFELRDLEANGLYDPSFFASVPTNDRLNTTWTVGSDSVSLNPGNYTGDTVTLSSVQADGNGTLQVVWSNNPDSGSVNDSAHWNAPPYRL